MVPSPASNRHSYGLRLLAFVRGPRFESNFGHLFHSRRQSIVTRRILIKIVDNTRTATLPCKPNRQMGINIYLLAAAVGVELK